MKLGRSIKAGIQSVTASTAVTVGGILSSVMTAVVHYLLSRILNVDVSSFMVWLFVPIGAIICGLAASFGYYFASIRVNYLPSRQIAFNYIAVALSTYMLVQYLSYLSLAFADGRPVSDSVTFWRYYQMSIESMNLNVEINHRSDSSGPLGNFGYFFEVIRILGFAGGGLAIFLYLKAVPICSKCKRYFRHAGDTIWFRFGDDTASFKNWLLKYATSFETLKESRNAIFLDELSKRLDAPSNMRSDFDKLKVSFEWCETCNYFKVNFKLSGKERSLPSSDFVVNTRLPRILG